ncbi:hypothetical protein EZV73_21475 [Acidaminobacter sp. JC074]|uniref:hypothetical protein n=1 Tax=Acidaminobacter sp. JC074 TaxID=2530199 RepID=UPI001F115047|nr:hypothetical protein [Acidaminobacter sp. JC074]MCH4890166.1 hypothetical protein [Acidaminobacter sp. JC074]
MKNVMITITLAFFVLVSAFEYTYYASSDLEDMEVSYKSDLEAYYNEGILICLEAQLAMSAYPSQVLENTAFKNVILDEMDKIKEKRSYLLVIEGCEEADKILDELLVLVDTNIELLENYHEDQLGFDEALDNNFRITELFMDFEALSEQSGVNLTNSSVRRMNSMTRKYVDGQRGD